MKNLHNALLLKQLYQLKNLGYRYTSEKPFSYDHKHSLLLANNLDELKKQAQNCHLCPLSKGRNHTVFGEGDSSAVVMFVGDIPIEQEDNQGKIFLGRGGEMLTRMIEGVLELSRVEVYLTNLLKCYPHHTHQPEESILHTCKAYLFKEIEIVQPKVIVTLGEHPYHYLTNDTTPLNEIHGHILERERYHIVPTYHPNFLLKNPSLKKEVFLDLKRVKSIF